MEEKVTDIFAKDRRLLTVSFPSIDIPISSGRHFRGAVAKKFKDNPYFHNHWDDGRIISPYVQYRVIDRTPIISAFGPATDALREALDKGRLNTLNIKQEWYYEEEPQTEEGVMAVVTSRHKMAYIYQARTPYIPLDVNPYENPPLTKAGLAERLKANFYHIATQFGIFLDRAPEVSVDIVTPIIVSVKMNPVWAYTMTMATNVGFNTACGLGKARHRGFGAFELSPCRDNWSGI